MKSTPSSTARRTTVRATSRSAGSPQMPGPVMRMAPKPSRLTVPRSLMSKVPAAPTLMVWSFAMLIIGATRRSERMFRVRAWNSHSHGARDREQVLPRAELDSGPALGVTRGPFGGIDRGPAAQIDQVGLTLAQPGRDRSRVDRSGRRPGPGQVGHQGVHRVNGVLLVRADDPGRAAFDPPGHVLAIAAVHPAVLVRDDSGDLVEGQARDGLPAVTDRPQDEAGGENLPFAGVHRAAVPAQPVAAEHDRFDPVGSTDLDRRGQEPQGAPAATVDRPDARIIPQD